jgi:hypothetical protein
MMGASKECHSRRLVRSERAQPHQPRLREKLLLEALIYPGTQSAGNYSIAEGCHVMLRALFLQNGMLSKLDFRL